MEEHINKNESHDASACPGPDACAVQRGLERLLAELDAGRLVITRVQ